MSTKTTGKAKEEDVYMYVLSFSLDYYVICQLLYPQYYRGW